MDFTNGIESVYVKNRRVAYSATFSQIAYILYIFKKRISILIFLL